jgi:hypothetical protein
VVPGSATTGRQQMGFGRAPVVDGESSVVPSSPVGDKLLFIVSRGFWALGFHSTFP